MVKAEARAPNGELELVEKEKPRATPGHVVIRMTLRAVNPSGLWLIKRKCAELESADHSDEFSSKLKDGRDVVPGSNGMGYVEELGEGVTKMKLGQRVVPSSLQNFYSRGDGSCQPRQRRQSAACYLVVAFIVLHGPNLAKRMIHKLRESVATV